MDIFKNKKVIGGVATVAILGLVYYLWTSSGATPLLSSSETGGTSPISQEILSTLGQLHTIKLDPAVFADPVFVSLTDFGVTIAPQQAGRRNPFAPIGADSQATPPPASPVAQ